MASKVVERVDNHSNWEETCLVTTIVDWTDNFEKRIDRSGVVGLETSIIVVEKWFHQCGARGEVFNKVSRESS
jgi:hypothetical protein